MEYEETKEQKIQRISNLLDTETKKVTHSIDNWHNYLDTASKFYKYSFTDQILISAQNPNASLCADYDLWKERFGRNVRQGSKGTPLLYEENGRKKLRYVFDISSTEKFANAREVKVWELKPEYENFIIKNLAEKNGLNYGKSLESIIEERIEMLLNDDGSKYLKNIIGNKENTFLKELDELNINVEFKDIVRNSAKYIIHSRCGLDAEFDDDLFRNTGDFNSNEVIT